MSGFRIGRDPTGWFKRDATGYLGNTRPSPLRIDGVTNISNVGFSDAKINFSLFCEGRRNDVPYGTPAATNPYGYNTTQSFVEVAGKFSPNLTTAIVRLRLGFSFPLAASYGTSFTAQLKMISNDWSNSLETFIPRVYASNTDDSALYTTGNSATPIGWELNTNNLLQLQSGGDMAYGDTTTQTLIIPSAIINANLGGHLSIICGTDKEFAGTGAGSSPSKDAFWGCDATAVNRKNFIWLEIH